MTENPEKPFRGYLLIIDVDDFPGNDDLRKLFYFEEEEDVLEWINTEMVKDDRYKIRRCFSIHDEVEFKPVERITQYKVV